MSKFKVGDKVVFNKEKAKRDIDRLVPGADSWLDFVPKGPLTIKEALGIATVRVEEGCFLLSTDWLDKYEEPVRVERFKVGDKVWFLPGEVTKVDPHNIWAEHVDPQKLYTITEISPDGDSIWIDDGGWNFVYSTNWLKKAEEYKCEVKISEGRIKDVKFSDPATIVFWTDGTKTVVKCRKGDKFDPEKGIAMACAKKLLGNEDGYHKEIAKYTKPVKKSEPPEDTEELRFIVSASCRSLPGCEVCPCRLKDDGGDGDCYFIAFTSREHLLEMYRSFEKAGKLRKGESNA